MDCKPSPKGVWSGGYHMGTNHISGTAKARVVKFCTQVGYVKSKNTDDKSPLKGT